MAKIWGVSANYKLLIRRKSHNKFHFDEIEMKNQLKIKPYTATMLVI